MVWYFITITSDDVMNRNGDIFTTYVHYIYMILGTYVFNIFAQSHHGVHFWLNLKKGELEMGRPIIE